MSKSPELNDVTNLANAVSALAQLALNNEKIEEAFANTVSRDGSSPNNMLADLDMDSHRLLNVADPVADTDGVNKRSVGALVDEFAASILENSVFGTQVVDTFSASPGQSVLTLSASAGSYQNLEVFVNGIALVPGTDFTVSGTELKTVTLADPLVGTEEVFARYSKALPTGFTDAGAVEYDSPSLGAMSLDVFLEELESDAGAGLVKWKQSETGAIVRTVEERLRERVSVKDFGAVGDGVTDDTAAIRYALSTGKDVYFPAGAYKITDQLTAYNGQIISGSGMDSTELRIDGSFNLSATSVLQLGTTTACHLRDMGFRFTQPDTSVRANVIQYPWAISLNGLAGVSIDQVKIHSCYNGIDARGNTGQANIGTVYIGNLNIGIYIDGALDFFHGKKWHFWPFGISLLPNLSTVYYDGVTTSLRCGRCDGLNVDTLASFSQLVWFDSNALNAIPSQINNLQLDNDKSRLLVNAGALQVGKVYTTATSADTTLAVSVDGAGAYCEIGMIYASTVRANNTLFVTNSATLVVNGGIMTYLNSTVPLARVDSGFMQLNNIRFNPNASVAFAQPHVVQAGGSMQVRGCSWATKGAGSGIAVQFTGDAAAQLCTANDFGGWSYAIPAGTLGYYHGNLAVAADSFQSSNLAGLERVRRLIGTADASGNLITAHGITGANNKVIMVQALRKGGSGEAVPCTVNYVDGTNVSISGALASGRVRITLRYTTNDDSW